MSGNGDKAQPKAAPAAFVRVVDRADDNRAVYHLRISLGSFDEDIAMRSVYAGAGYLSVSRAAGLFMKMPGVQAWAVKKYRIEIEKGERFTWEEVDDSVAAAIEECRRAIAAAAAMEAASVAALNAETDNNQPATSWARRAQRALANLVWGWWE
ncbi:MAG: hypothetical protein VW405_10970 [Rhodospirillaceae bacterium]